MNGSNPLSAPRGQEEEGLSREAFERVWRRVMPRDRPDCPFTLCSDAPAPQSAPTRAEGPALPAPPARQERAVTLELQGFFLEEGEELLRCRRLAGLLPAPHAAALAAMAEDHRRALRQLAGAYFLLTGLRLAPPAARRRGRADPLSLLREQYGRARRSSLRYGQASSGHPDPQLARLYSALARQAEGHARRLGQIPARLGGVL